jgi:hypothetical protein
MADRINRRKETRHPVSWTAAVVFDAVFGRPMVRTCTHNLSVGGASILSGYPDLDGVVLTLLLVPLQGAHAGDAQLTIRVRARVVSTQALTGGPLYRHGLSFVHGHEDELEMLSGLLGEAMATSPAALDHRADAAHPSAERSRLTQFSRLAQARVAAERKLLAREQPTAAIGASLRKTYGYLKEFAGALDVVQPAFAPRCYAIAGVPDFRDLAWAQSRVCFNTPQAGAPESAWTSVSLHYRLSANRQLTVARDYPASEALARVLTENLIDFRTHETGARNGLLVRRVFTFACEVAASLVFTAAPESGTLHRKMRNVERFGMAEATIAPEAVDDASLDALAAYVLAETNQIAWLSRAGEPVNLVSGLAGEAGGRTPPSRVHAPFRLGLPALRS